MNGMYTIEQEGENVLVDRSGNPVEWKAIEKQANALIKASGGTR